MDFTASGAFGKRRYVQTIPAICDFNHGLDWARAVTIHRLDVPRQDTDRAWLKLQGMR